MDLELTIEDARELGRVLREWAEEHREEDSERIMRIARRVERLLSTPVVHHDPFA